MKTIFILCVGILVIFMINCIVIAFKKNNRYSEPVTNLILAAISAMLFYSIHLVVYDELEALLLKGFFFANLDWLLYFMIKYVHIFTDVDIKMLRVKLVKLLFGTLIIADTVSLVFNAFFQYSFSVLPAYDETGDFYCWKVEYKPLFYVHILFCYILVLYAIFVLIRKFFQVSRVYRRKYFIIIVLFSTTCFLNALRMVFDWILDSSIFFYGILAATICYFTFFIFPKEVEASMHYIVAEHIKSFVICFNLDGKCMYISKYAKNLFPDTEDGKRKAEEYRKNWIEPDTALKTWEDRIILQGKEHIFVVEYRCIRDKRKRMEGSYLKFEDRTEEIIHLENERYRATHDPLTGLYNRTAFFEKAEEIIRNNPNEPRYLIATNIKDFKLINDLFGTEFGDEIIKEQAKMLGLANYDDCVQGRITADKFAMLIAKKDYTPELAIKNTRKIQAVAKEVNYNLILYIGVYDIKNTWEKVQTMYDKANMAIDSIHGEYEKNLVYYDAALMEQTFMEKYIVGEFVKALEQKYFELCMTPQIDAEYNIRSVDMSLNWNHSVLGLLTPDKYYPTLEKTGYTYLLEQHLWKLAMEQIADHTLNGDKNFHATVKISPKVFYYVDMCKILEDLLRKYEVDAKQMYLEITETAFRQDTKKHIATLVKLQEYGFKIVICNFGSGFSSLNLLKDIKVDILKLDKEFIKKTENEERSKTILSMIISMAEKLQIRVAADGVESRAQMEFLENVGCVCFEGTYCTEIVQAKQNQ